MSRINWPWQPKPKPVPPPDVTPDKPAPQWLRAWLLFRKIPVQKLFPALTLTSFVVFLALSGLLAWIVVILAFAVQLFRVLT
jgi:hypothetical protein